MGAYLIRRLLRVVVLLLAITTLLFFLLRLMPGDPALVLLGDAASEADLAVLRAHLGLDKPLYVQFLVFLGDLARGDMGMSRQYNSGAMQIVMDRFPATLQLAGASVLLAVGTSIPLAVLCAATKYRPLDIFAMVVSTVVQSIPIFWLGMVLVLIFAVQLRWLPSYGAGGLQHVLLPAVSLAAWLSGTIFRLMRATMLEVMDEDYVRTARSKGLREKAVVLNHALRNALIPVITVVGLQLGGLLGGAVVTETVFAWPGVGSLVANAVFTRDYPVIQSSVLVVAGSYAAMNLLVDVLYTVIDPRIRY
ncbi:MAG: ABC transporter permease [Chloroflexota bacterium]